MCVFLQDRTEIPWNCKNGATTYFSSVQFSHSVMSNSVTPWTAAHQASLSITKSQRLLKLMSMSRWYHPTILSFVVPFSSIYTSMSVNIFQVYVLNFKYIYIYLYIYRSICRHIHLYTNVYAYKYFYLSLNVNFRNIHLWHFFPLCISWLVPALHYAAFLLVLVFWLQRKLLSISLNTLEQEKCVTVNKTWAEDNNLLRLFFNVYSATTACKSTNRIYVEYTFS